MTINERLVRISAGLTPIEQELELGKDVQLVVSGNVVKVEQQDQQDNTYNLIYVIKGLVSYVNDERTD